MDKFVQRHNRIITCRGRVIMRHDFIIMFESEWRSVKSNNDVSGSNKIMLGSSNNASRHGNEA